MTREKFDEIVQRLTAEARRRPRFYQAKVALLAASGYAYLLLVFLVASALLLTLVALALTGKGIVLIVKGGWLLLLFVWAILRSLWVRLPAPEGRRLTRAEAPALFTVLDEFRRELKAQPFHEVVVNHEFNAAVTQVPRLGILGWHRNYLLLGLPFMEAMPVAEFKAVIAHEYGHLASGHARFSNWIYRQRETWSRIVAQMAAQGQGGWLIAPFIKRFVPYFNAYSFVLARSNEYEADRASVRLVGAPTVATALLRSEVLGNFLSERVYPDFYRQAAHAPSPSTTFSRHFLARMATGPTVGDTARWMTRAAARKTDSGDTHPAFTDRVGAVGAVPDLGPARGTTAAEALLGPTLVAELHREHDQLWEEANRAQWKARYDEAEKSRARLAELEKDLGWSHPKPEQMWERASLVEELRSAEQALPLFLELRAKDPKHPAAAFACGRLLLAQGDAGGAAFLEQAMQLDWRSVIPACDLLYGFYLDRSEEAAAATILRRYREQQDRLELAQEERARLERGLKCEPHGLRPEQLKEALEMIRLEKSVARAWLVRKQVQYFPDEPLFILAVKVPWWHMHGEGYYAQLIARLADRLKLPGQYFVVSLDSSFSWLAGRMKKTPDSLIYTRS